MTEYASGGFTGNNGPHGYVHEAKFSLMAPLNSEIEQAASNWVSKSLDELRDMTTAEVAHEGFVSGVEWVLGIRRSFKELLD